MIRPIQIKKWFSGRYPGIAQIYRSIRRWWLTFWKNIRFMLRRTRKKKQIISYLSSHSNPKIHIGAGKNLLDGWLNTDKYPNSNKICYMDAEKPFPFENSSVDFVFSEHIIEHLSYDSGLFMLKECFRILKPGGVLRVATPDFKALIDLYFSQEENSRAEKYKSHMMKRYFSDISYQHALFIINNMFYNWGHKFIYDKSLLESILIDAGFEKIQLCEFGESAIVELRCIDSHGKIIGDDDVASFETVTMEATRPH